MGGKQRGYGYGPCPGRYARPRASSPRRAQGDCGWHGPRSLARGPVDAPRAGGLQGGVTATPAGRATGNPALGLNPGGQLLCLPGSCAAQHDLDRVRGASGKLGLHRAVTMRGWLPGGRIRSSRPPKSSVAERYGQDGQHRDHGSQVAHRTAHHSPGQSRPHLLAGSPAWPVGGGGPEAGWRSALMRGPETASRAGNTVSAPVMAARPRRSRPAPWTAGTPAGRSAGWRAQAQPCRRGPAPHARRVTVAAIRRWCPCPPEGAHGIG